MIEKIDNYFFLSHFSEPLNGFLKFKCDICNRKFEKRTRMIRHIKNMHSSDIHRVDLSKFVLPKKFQQRHTWSLIELWQIAEGEDVAPHPWGQSHAYMGHALMGHTNMAHAHMGHTHMAELPTWATPSRATPTWPSWPTRPPIALFPSLLGLIFTTPTYNWKNNS